MTNLVFILEEPSAKALLKGLLPRLLKQTAVPHYLICEGKQDLENNLLQFLRSWKKPESSFIVLLDQDQENCKNIKKRLLKKCEESKIRQKYIIRIACRELESWYFGDLNAVEKALRLRDGKLSRYKDKSPYRVPDKIQNPAEKLMQITKGSYQKISGSRAVGPNLSLTGNRSKSFQVFIEGVKKIMDYPDRF